jgi:hypothetical protein
MAKCECLEGCPFFNDKIPIDSALGIVYKEKYCLDRFNDCARHKVKVELGRENIPASLYPNMQDLAQQIIKEHQLISH